jgi:hypothetical protein
MIMLAQWNDHDCVVRSAMNDDVSDDILLNVSDVDLVDLLDEDYDSGLRRVVQRVIAANADAYNGWHSMI